MLYSSRLMVKAISYNGASINSGSVFCDFGAGERISIGRGSANHLVLEDPSRLISRVQAHLAYRDGSSATINNVSSSTGIFIGATELQPGFSAVVSLTDTLMIGAYILKLEPVKTSSVNASVIGSAESSYKFPDSTSIIPDDFDFFSAEKSLENVVSSNASLESINDENENNLLLGNLSELGLHEDLLNFGDGVLDDRLLKKEESDPLALLASGAAANSSETYHLDEGIEVGALFAVPRVARSSDSVYQSSAKMESGSDIFVPVHDHRATQIPVDKLAVEALNPSVGLPDEHRHALARGLQIEPNKLPELTTDFFEKLGGILLHLTAGAVNMMHERAQIKHEMRADVTIIASSGNNPLKFAPDAQSALVHLLGERVPGFMHSVEAIDDAFDDLLAHQIGMMSGARAAVYDVVKDFSPEKIHKYMVNKNFIDSFLPMSKKSKLWELYETHYSDVAGNAKEDFELRFQQAFSQAYEQEIDRMCEARERA